MFKRFLEPRSGSRPKSLGDLTKFLDDRWLAKTAEKEMAEYETDELCPSMYSFHSSPDEKNRLLYTLADCGIETNVDRQLKKNRIKDWIESSIITEEDEVRPEAYHNYICISIQLAGGERGDQLGVPNIVCITRTHAWPHLLHQAATAAG